MQSERLSKVRNSHVDFYWGSRVDSYWDSHWLSLRSRVWIPDFRFQSLNETFAEVHVDCTLWRPSRFFAIENFSMKAKWEEASERPVRRCQWEANEVPTRNARNFLALGFLTLGSTLWVRNWQCFLAGSSVRTPTLLLNEQIHEDTLQLRDY